MKFDTEKKKWKEDDSPSPETKALLSKMTWMGTSTDQDQSSANSQLTDSSAIRRQMENASKTIQETLAGLSAQF